MRPKFYMSEKERTCENMYSRILGALEGRDDKVIAEHNTTFDCIIIYDRDASILALIKYDPRVNDSKRFSVLGPDDLCFEERFNSLKEMCDCLADNNIIASI